MPAKKRCCYLASSVSVENTEPIILKLFFFATAAKVLSVLFHHVNAYWLVAEGTFHIQIV